MNKNVPSRLLLWGIKDHVAAEEATMLAGNIWQALGREQYCHISSPRNGWQRNEPVHMDKCP